MFDDINYDNINQDADIDEYRRPFPMRPYFRHYFPFHHHFHFHYHMHHHFPMHRF